MCRTNDLKSRRIHFIFGVYCVCLHCKYPNHPWKSVDRHQSSLLSFAKCENSLGFSLFYPWPVRHTARKLRTVVIRRQLSLEWKSLLYPPQYPCHSKNEIFRLWYHFNWLCRTCFYVRSTNTDFIKTIRTFSYTFDACDKCSYISYFYSQEWWKIFFLLRECWQFSVLIILSRSAWSTLNMNYVININVECMNLELNLK